MVTTMSASISPAKARIDVNRFFRTRLREPFIGARKIGVPHVLQNEYSSPSSALQVGQFFNILSRLREGGKRKKAFRPHTVLRTQPNDSNKPQLNPERHSPYRGKTSNQ